jgi:hypothetical protein
MIPIREMLLLFLLYYLSHQNTLNSCKLYNYDISATLILSLYELSTQAFANDY